MPINLETSPSKGLVELLADMTGSQMTDSLFHLPKNFGEGYIKRFKLEPHFDIMIHDYELADEVTLKRTATFKGSNKITFSFRNAFNRMSKHTATDVHKSGRTLSSVQVSSGDVELDFFYPAKTHINTLLITVDASALTNLIGQESNHPLLQTILSSAHSYLYEEFVSPDIQQVATQIVLIDGTEALHGFYLKLKIQELIYLFFRELLKRQEVVNYSINTDDIKKVYWVKDKILADLSLPPNLPQLAHLLGMSESKLKRLFKQIFGNSIYQYYQTFRLNEAAQLIKNQKLSIAETGYRLGFTNLSHFGRLFEQHIGLKPKKYSTANATP